MELVGERLRQSETTVRVEKVVLNNNIFQE